MSKGGSYRGPAPCLGLSGERGTPGARATGRRAREKRPRADRTTDYGLRGEGGNGTTRPRTMGRRAEGGAATKLNELNALEAFKVLVQFSPIVPA